MGICIQGCHCYLVLHVLTAIIHFFQYKSGHYNISSINNSSLYACISVQHIEEDEQTGTEINIHAGRDKIHRTNLLIEERFFFFIFLASSN